MYRIMKYLNKVTRLVITELLEFLFRNGKFSSLPLLLLFLLAQIKMFPYGK